MMHNIPANIKLTILSIIALLISSAIYQLNEGEIISLSWQWHTENYDYSDQRTLFGLHNFFNIIANIPLLLLGIAGVIMLLLNPIKQWMVIVHRSEYGVWYCFFFGIALLAINSIRFHLEPQNNAYAIYDTVALLLILMSLMIYAIGERLHHYVYYLMPIILCLLAVATALLETYLIPILSWMLYGGIFLFCLMIEVIKAFHATYQPNHYKRWIMGWLVIGAVLAFYDQAVYYLLGQSISGHALGKISVALSLYYFLVFLCHRKTIA